MELIFEKSVCGKGLFLLPEESSSRAKVSERFMRKIAPRLPELSDTELNEIGRAHV